MKMYEKLLIGKTIKSLEISGDDLILETEDGLELIYAASDGGYSTLDIVNKNAEVEE